MLKTSKYQKCVTISGRHACQHTVVILTTLANLGLPYSHSMNQNGTFCLAPPPFAAPSPLGVMKILNNTKIYYFTDLWFTEIIYNTFTIMGLYVSWKWVRKFTIFVFWFMVLQYFLCLSFLNPQSFTGWVICTKLLLSIEGSIQCSGSVAMLNIGIHYKLFSSTKFFCTVTEKHSFSPSYFIFCNFSVLIFQKNCVCSSSSFVWIYGFDKNMRNICI